MFLARTVTRTKWQSNSGASVGEIPADAVTGDLRTRDTRCPFGGAVSVHRRKSRM